MSRGQAKTIYNAQIFSKKICSNQSNICMLPAFPTNRDKFVTWTGFQITKSHEMEASKAEKTGSKQKFPPTCS
jgi:hypothetical protein